MIANIRVFICMAECSSFFGWLFHPLVVVLVKVLKFSPSDRILGCSCFDSDRPSLLSWLPVSTCTALVQLIKILAREFLPLPEAVLDNFVLCVDMAHPLLSFLFDITFSIGLAKALAILVDLVDEAAQERLVWMSMGLARVVRSAPTNVHTAGGPSAHPVALAAPAASDSSGPIPP